MAISKIILNGVTQMDVTGKTVTASSMLNGVTALKNDGTDVTGSIQDMTLPTASSATSAGTSKATITPGASAQYLNIPTGYNGTAQYYTIAAASGGGSNVLPMFTVTWDNNFETVLSVTCDKTYAECDALFVAGVSSANVKDTDQSEANPIYPVAVVTGTGTGTITYTVLTGNNPTYDLTYNSDGTISFIQPSTHAEVLNVTQNGTYTPGSGFLREVNVTVSGSSKNWQIAQTTNRVSSSTATTVSNLSITVNTTGTYNVYWAGFRSSTSGTNGAQLFINDSAYGSENTTFTNHIQSVKLTGVSLTEDDVLTIKARSRGSNYYMYVTNLVIEQTS